MDWISVKDRLPNKSGMYLVYEGNTGYVNKIGVDFYSTKLESFGDAGDVTHWMPLPEPPDDSATYPQTQGNAHKESEE